MAQTLRQLTQPRRPWRRLPGFLHQHAQWLAVSMLALSFFGLLTFLAASVSRGATEPTAMLSWDYRQALVSGVFSCLPGEMFELQLTLSQSPGGVEGIGFLSAPCHGGVQRWTGEVMALAGANFFQGPARACTVGTLYQANSVMDTRQWCRDILLLSHEGGE